MRTSREQVLKRHRQELGIEEPDSLDVAVQDSPIESECAFLRGIQIRLDEEQRRESRRDKKR